MEIKVSKYEEALQELQVKLKQIENAQDIRIT